MWGIFTLFMFFGTLKGPKALQVVFGTLVVLFFLLAAKDFTGNAAFYTALRTGRPVLKIFKQPQAFSATKRL